MKKSGILDEIKKIRAWTREARLREKELRKRLRRLEEKVDWMERRSHHRDVAGFILDVEVPPD